MDWSGRERDKLFVSNLGLNFLDLSYLGGVDNAQDGRAFAYADFDHDGATDIVLINRNAPVLQIYRNTILQQDWISLHLIGDGRQTTPDAVGTVVTATCGERQIKRCLDLGTGFGVQNTNTLVIGLGDCEAADRVTVRWPGGKEQTFERVKTREFYRLKVMGKLELVPGYYQTPLKQEAPAQQLTSTRK